MTGVSLTFKNLLTWFLQWLCHFMFSPHCSGVPVAPHPQRHVVCSVFFILAVQVGMQWQLTVVLIIISLIT